MDACQDGAQRPVSWNLRGELLPELSVAKACKALFTVGKHSPPALTKGGGCDPRPVGLGFRKDPAKKFDVRLR